MATSTKGRSRVKEKIVLWLMQKGSAYTIRKSGDAKVIRLDVKNSKAFFDLVKAVKRGHHVSVIDSAKDLTPNQAALRLGVSRPFLRAQMEAGWLPFRMVGTHHRIRLVDCDQFRTVLADREHALQRLADLGQSLEAH